MTQAALWSAVDVCEQLTWEDTKVTPTQQTAYQYATGRIVSLKHHKHLKSSQTQSLQTVYHHHHHHSSLVLIRIKD